MIGLSTCARIGLAFFFFTVGGIVSAQSSSRSEQEATGVLKGELPIPPGLARPHPFILAYSAVYGEQVIPVEEQSLTARFEVRLRPGIYYLFFALDGYEPTCHVADIGSGEIVLYNPKRGEPILINDYVTPPKKLDLQLPSRYIQLPSVSPAPPR
jgi:hypothetical protein